MVRTYLTSNQCTVLESQPVFCLLKKITGLLGKLTTNTEPYRKRNLQIIVHDRAVAAVVICIPDVISVRKATPTESQS